MSDPITVWWGIPCKSVVPVFRALTEEQGRSVRFVALHDLPPHRKRLGWVMPDPGRMPLEVLGEEAWEAAVERALADGRDHLHIVNGIYHDVRVRYVANALAKRGYRFGVIMEAPANLATGARRVVKQLVAPVVTPLRTWAVARKALFVLSASGARKAAFKALGFAPDRIHPFGYFPDFPPIARTEPGEAADSELRILCIGYLEPFKGQDCLLRALARLGARGVRFRCAVTGYGSAGEPLKALTDKLGLADRVEFVGVVPNARLVELFAWSNVLVAPGLEEPWGIRVNEALLSGLPVVVSDGVGAKDLVIESGAGEVFAAGSDLSLANALQTLQGRMAAGDELTGCVSAIRTAIRPGAAADYLNMVLDRVEADQDAESPLAQPPWISVRRRRTVAETPQCA